jgi:nucleoside 2-deoxyribosyltransferase
MRIYLAGPVFTTAERSFNQELARRLRASGHEVWLPQEHDSDDKEVLFQICVEGILWSEVVVACLDGPDPDSGTCAECGFAFLKRPIVAYRTDFRAGGDGGSWNYNLVLGGMATVRLDAVRAGKQGGMVYLCQAVCTALDLAEVKNFVRGDREQEEANVATRTFETQSEAELVLWAVAPDADRAIDAVVANEGVYHVDDVPPPDEGECLYKVRLLARPIDRPATSPRRKT